MIFSLYHLLEFEEFANWSSWGSISLNFLLYFRYMFMIIILSTQAGSIWYLPQHALTGPCHFGLTVKKCGSETSSSLEDAKGWEKQSGFLLERYPCLLLKWQEFLPEPLGEIREILKWVSLKTTKKENENAWGVSKSLEARMRLSDDGEWVPWEGLGQKWDIPINDLKVRACFLICRAVGSH